MWNNWKKGKDIGRWVWDWDRIMSMQKKVKVMVEKEASAWFGYIARQNSAMCE